MRVEVANDVPGPIAEPLTSMDFVAGRTPLPVMETVEWEAEAVPNSNLEPVLLLISTASAVPIEKAETALELYIAPDQAQVLARTKAAAAT
ncbi:MAG: hypothetical protein ACKVQQ_21095 [Burkholderiales bacterium]